VANKQQIMTLDDGSTPAVGNAAEQQQHAATQVISGSADPALSGKRAKVEVPIELVGVLNDAVEEVFEASGGIVSKRSRPRFSYQVHG